MRDRVKGVFITAKLVNEVLGIVTAFDDDEEKADELPFEALDNIINILSMQETTFEELKSLTHLDDHQLSKALLKLEKEGLIIAKDGRYRLTSKKKAKELGFNIVEELWAGGE